MERRCWDWVCGLNVGTQGRGAAPATPESKRREGGAKAEECGGASPAVAVPSKLGSGVDDGAGERKRSDGSEKRTRLWMLAVDVGNPGLQERRHESPDVWGCVLGGVEADVAGGQVGC